MFHFYLETVNQEYFLHINMTQKCFMFTCSLLFCHQLENGIGQRETKRSLLYLNEAPGQKEPSSLPAENIITETVHNG